MPAVDGVVDAVARPPIDLEFPYPAADRPAVSEVSVLQPDQAGCDPRLGLSVPDLIKPTTEKIVPVVAAVVPQFIHNAL